MIRNLTLLLFAVITLQACNVMPASTWQNDHIEKAKREQIKILNDKLFKAMAANNHTAVKSLLSDSLRKVLGTGLDSMLVQMASIVHDTTQYAIIAEYNTTTLSPNVKINLTSGVSGDSNFVVSYTAIDRESYVSLLRVKGIFNDYLFTIIYGNHDNQWEINVLYLGVYNYYNTDPTTLYKIAGEHYYNSSVIDAVNYVMLAKGCLRPAGTYVHYDQEQEIDTFYKRVLTETNARYKLPLTLKWIDTKPVLLSEYPQLTTAGPVPAFYYQTSISLKDTAALKKEYELVKNEVRQYFPGLEKDTYVIYYAYNEVPTTDKKEVLRYGFVDSTSVSQ